jgi:hypothetical protein
MPQGTNSSTPTTAQLVGGTYNATAPVLVDGQAASLQFDTNGNLKTFSELTDGTNVSGTTANPLKVQAVGAGELFAVIAVSATGTIVALVAAKKIRVVALQLTASAGVNVKWQSHVTPTDITGLAYFAANGGYVLPYNPAGWFQTIAGEALDINLSAAVAVGGSLTYVTV